MTTLFNLKDNILETDRLNRLLGLGRSIGAMAQVKLGRPLLKVLFLITPVVGIKRNLSVVKVLITFAANVYRLSKKGGLRFGVIYLKASSTLLQQAIGGQRLSDLGPLGARVSRTKAGGLPRLIPAIHRKRIRGGDRQCIQFWLSLFSLYRVLDIPGKVNLKTITSPSTADLGLLGEFSRFAINCFWPWIKEKWSVDGSVTDALWDGALDFMKQLRAKPFLISKSTPVSSLSGGDRLTSTSPLSILLSARLWKSEVALHLYPILEAWCKFTRNQWVLNRIDLWSSETIDPRPKHGLINRRGETFVDGTPSLLVGARAKPFKASWNHFLGKLGFKLESAGKVRVFAMVDCFTQWLLEPLHAAIFKLLRVIPQDGTFAQTKPLARLIERQSELRKRNFAPGATIPVIGSWKSLRSRSKATWALFSFDLSSATDRLPLVFQKALLSPILTAWGAEVWGCLLVSRSYLIPERKDLGLSKTEVVYAAGQPMGALSSWALLALTHHCIVQWAWCRVCSRNQERWSWYQDYAVLGDDVVILGRSVAAEYVVLMEALGVSIGMHKSLVSLSGDGLEFAKRTLYKGEDVSAVPFKEVLVSKANLPSLLELTRKYSLSLGRVMTFLGYGYIAKSRLSNRLWALPERMRNYIVAYYSPSMPSFAGLVKWLSLRSVDNFYHVSEERLGRLVQKVLDLEKQSLLKILDRYQPLIAEAGRLSTVYRDREHYGSIGRGLRIANPDSDQEYHSSVAVGPHSEDWVKPHSTGEGLRFPYGGPTDSTAGRPASRIYYHAGVSTSVSQTIVDSLNETVYRETFLDVISDARELRAKVEALDVNSDIDIEALWETVREIERNLSVLPLPRALVISSGLKSLGKSSDLRRWKLYSRIFRSTVA